MNIAIRICPLVLLALFSFAAEIDWQCLNPCIKGVENGVLEAFDDGSNSARTQNSQSGRTIVVSHQSRGVQQKQTIRILFLGNSHTRNHNVPKMVKNLLEADGKNQVVTDAISSPFLGDLANRGDVQKVLETGKWNFVVMQGQKISMSGRFKYSTNNAERLSKLANDSGARVVWFSEWGRRGVQGESKRIGKIYDQIRAVNNDLLAPIGETWEAAFAKRPKLVLHNRDGNHANPTGAFLAALTLYAVIAQDDCQKLPENKSSGIDVELQSFLKSIVSDITKNIVAEQSMENERHTPEKNAIQRVLAADNDFSSLRNKNCSKKSLDETINEYVIGVRSCDFSGCPAEFKNAFADHLQAWENSISFFKQFPELRGEMHALFEQIRKRGGNTKVRLEEIEKDIWATWSRVEHAAIDNAGNEQPRGSKSSGTN